MQYLRILNSGFMNEETSSIQQIHLNNQELHHLFINLNCEVKIHLLEYLMQLFPYGVVFFSSISGYNCQPVVVVNPMIVCGKFY